MKRVVGGKEQRSSSDRSPTASQIKPSTSHHSEANHSTPATSSCVALSLPPHSNGGETHRTRSSRARSIFLSPSISLHPPTSRPLVSPLSPATDIQYCHIPSHTALPLSQLQPTSPLSPPVILLSKPEINNHSPFPHTRKQASVHISPYALPRKASFRLAEI